MSTLCSIKIFTTSLVALMVSAQLSRALAGSETRKSAIRCSRLFPSLSRTHALWGSSPKSLRTLSTSLRVTACPSGKVESESVVRIPTPHTSAIQEAGARETDFTDPESEGDPRNESSLLMLNDECRDVDADGVRVIKLEGMLRLPLSSPQSPKLSWPFIKAISWPFTNVF
ncbi:hypothetical protein TWF569_011980 [Orbilia oligospora]|nr:hypothetical protein TWF569_011980 [Orbilia oligospora]